MKKNNKFYWVTSVISLFFFLTMFTPIFGADRGYLTDIGNDLKLVDGRNNTALPLPVISVWLSFKRITTASGN